MDGMMTAWVVAERPSTDSGPRKRRAVAGLRGCGAHVDEHAQLARELRVQRDGGRAGGAVAEARLARVGDVQGLLDVGAVEVIGDGTLAAARPRVTACAIRRQFAESL